MWFLLTVIACPIHSYGTIWRAGLTRGDRIVPRAGFNEHKGWIVWCCTLLVSPSVTLCSFTFSSEWMNTSCTTASICIMMRDDPETIKGGGWSLLSQRWVNCMVIVPSGLAHYLLLYAFMDSPSESSASSNMVVEEDIKRKLKKMHRLLHCMDTEGGCRLENVD